MHAEHAGDLQLGDLIAAFWAKYPDADKVIYERLFKSLSETPVTPEVGRDILKQIKRRKALLKLSEKAFRVAQGLEKEEDLEQFITEMPKDDHQEKQDLPLLQTSNDLTELLEHAYQDQGYRWRLDCLNKSLGSLREGDFGFIFARPETGKTTFLASEVTHFALSSTRPIIWLNNEEQGIKVMLRVYQAYFGVTTEQLLSNSRKYKDEFTRQTAGRFYLFDSATIDRKDIETIVRKLEPGVVVYDQIDKIKGFSNDREDLRLGSIYQWARELAKGNHAAIGVCQADGGAEGVRFLTMEHVANAKCLGPDTKVLMYNGDWRKVRDISVGEQVMGPDSTPRNVLDVAWGRSKMYSVHHNIGGDGYLVNKDHILSLVKSNNGKDTVVNMSVEEYILLKNKKPYFGYRVGYELDEEKFLIEPYYLGLWLGDGKATAPEITTLEPEVKQYVQWYAKCWGGTYVEWQNGKDNPQLVQAKIKYQQGVRHPLMEALRKLNLEGNKHIPDQYFKGSQDQRRQLLAGLLDTDGTLVKRNHEYYSFTNKNKQIAFGVKQLALSVGMYSTCYKRGNYYYVHISGDLSTIPCLVKRKKSVYKPLRDVLRSSISVYEIKDEMEYCGILIDGDHLFMVENCIVTHNTAKQAEADWILGIGKIHEQGAEYVRYLNICKNKLLGDKDSMPDLRHGRFEVMIQPEIARYKDIIKYD